MAELKVANYKGRLTVVKDGDEVVHVSIIHRNAENGRKVRSIIVSKDVVSDARTVTIYPAAIKAALENDGVDARQVLGSIVRFAEGGVS